jgi:hypothetical protein
LRIRDAKPFSAEKSPYMQHFSAENGQPVALSEVIPL